MGDALEIAVGDRLLFRLRNVGRLEEAQGVARIHRALFRIERAVGREQHLVGRVEGKPAHGGGVGAELQMEARDGRRRAGILRLLLA